MAKTKIVIKIGKNKTTILADKVTLQEMQIAKIVIEDTIAQMELEEVKTVLEEIDKMNKEISGD